MHILGHALSAVPFLLYGNYWAAAGAVLPDLTWIMNEVRFRRSGFRSWHEWVETVPEERITPYRVAHSLFMVLGVIIASAFNSWALNLALGWVLHLALDQPTHSGRMTQQPLWPIPWRFPWHM